MQNSLRTLGSKLSRGFSSPRREEHAQGKGPLLDVFKHTWLLGFTSFGGPPTHFKIFHETFVEKLQWIDEQAWQEIFAISQALSGPASTKALFVICTVRAGFLAGFMALFLWALPGAAGMYGLSLGIARTPDILPGPVYALISGLNAATVGIIALAGVQLAEKAITDRLTRILVCAGGIAGILYTALWYIPVLMSAGGLLTMAYDLGLWNWILVKLHIRKPFKPDPEGSPQPETEMNKMPSANDDSPAQLRRVGTPTAVSQPVIQQPSQQVSEARTTPSETVITVISWKTGLAVIVAFLISFVIIITLRNTLSDPPRPFALFGNMYLAGTIIFGGGPVVIPLLRDYVVSPGWVSSRDFLLGLAIIQAFPGPNFNFAIFLGSLAVNGTGTHSAIGALIAFLGIFTPGIVIASGCIGLWKELRSRRWVRSLLRGINALAVGLVFAAVYRLYQIGLVEPENRSGIPLGTDPWWIAMTAMSFVSGRWFGLQPFFAIILGGIGGLLWYAIIEL